MAARRLRAVALAGVCLLLLDPALSAETKTYTYDAQGRLVTTTVSGGPASGVQATTTFDTAGNRTNHAITGGAGASVIFAVSGPGPVVEGGTAVFTVSRTGNSSMAASVDYATANGSAVAPGDYAAASGTLSFASGQTSKTVSIAVHGDGIADANEQFSLVLNSPSTGADIGTGSASATIAEPYFTISGGASVVEGGAATFTVTKTGATPGSTTVNWSTANGTAASGADFSGGSGALTFGPSETSKTITIGTIDDSAPEPAETFSVSLSSPSAGMALGTSSASATINDMVVFSISGGGAVDEGGTLSFTVAKSGTATGTLTVNYTTSDGSAVNGADYYGHAGTLTFLASETSKTINVATIVDTAGESYESFSVVLYSPSSGSRIGTGSASGTINPSLPPNNPPVAVNDGMTVQRCGYGEINVTANDYDPDGGPVELIAVRGATIGDAYLISSTTIGYQPYWGYTGSEWLTYTIRDSRGGLAEGTLSIQVSGPQSLCE